MIRRFYRIDVTGKPRYAIQDAGEWRLVAGDIFGEFKAGEELDVKVHRLLPPVDPSKIVCVGLNYKDHAAEQNKPLPAEPLIFIKPSTAVIAAGEPIVLHEGIGLQRRQAAIVFDAPADLPDTPADRVHFVDHDAASR